MNIKECIDTVDNLKPNQYTIKEKVMWLSFIEEIIINDVLKTHEGYDGRYDDFEGYSEDKISVTLIVPSPYDRLYTAYLTMKIDESNGETTRYNNSATLYNSYMMEYRKYYNKTHMPIDVIGGKRHLKPQHKPSVGLSDAEYDNIVKDLTFKLTEYFSNTISPDKLYDIVMKFVQNNVEMLKGKDGRDGVDGKDGHTPAVGVDYFTENDKMEFMNRLIEHINKFEISNGDVTTDLLADGAVTGDKIADETISGSKFNEDVIGLIASNKFDGYIATIADADGINNRDNPHNLRIFRVGKDNGKGEGGILFVSGDTNPLYEHRPLDRIRQTYITHDGYVKTRHATNWDGYDGLVFEWSEWESRYLTHTDITEIVNTAEGESIALPDSADAQLKGLKVFGRTEQYTNGYQLFDANDLIGGNANLDGASLTVNKDGSFTITNNKSQNAHFSYTNYIAVKSIFKTGKALSLKVYGATNVEVALAFSDYGDIGIDGTLISNRADGKNSFEMTQSILDNAASLTVLMNGMLDSSSSETIKIMLYQDGDGTWEQFTGGRPGPTTELPCKLVSVGDDGSVDVNVYGKNLLPYPYKDTTVTENGVTWTVNNDRSLTAKGTATGYSDFVIYNGEDIFPKKYTFACIGINSGSNIGISVEYRNNDTRLVSFNSTSGSVDVDVTNIAQKITGVLIYSKRSKDENINCKFYPIIADTNTFDGVYEPFKPIQTLTVSTPNGLPAVPVPSDGNYTDASGQQWVCDEKDYDRDVYVTRTTKLVLNGNEDWKTWGVNNKAEGITAFYTYVAPTIPLSTANTSIICSHLPAVGGVYGGGAVGCGIFASATKPYVGISVSNDCLEDVSSNDAAIASFKRLLSESNMTVIYPKIPEETPLSAEEIAAYKALHTHYPHTSIHNSDNAHMAVDYVADTKNYVDNQIKKEIAELKALILEV